MDLDVNAKALERMTERIGEERCAERDGEVEAYRKLPLTERKDKPDEVVAPDLAVVGVDGGRLQILERTGQGKSASAKSEEEAPLSPEAGHRGKHWREDKIGLLMTMTSVAAATDPCPEVPAAFVDPTRILKLTRELKTKRSASEESSGEEAAAPSKAPEAEEQTLREEAERVRWQPPEVKEKHLSATRRSWSLFGPMLAYQAWMLGFYQAKRKAFLGDGAENNWTLWRTRFSSFEPILDIIHAISYVFAAALAGRSFQEGWPCYVRWVTWLWQGSVEQVIAELAQRQTELGVPRADEGETHPRVVISRALGYLQNHKDKMRYPEYRRQGLPITSSYVESAVKQFNQRVKGTEKFWREDGAEALLQLRADYLSHGDPMDSFWQRRQASQTGMNNYTTAA